MYESMCAAVINIVPEGCVYEDTRHDVHVCGSNSQLPLNKTCILHGLECRLSSIPRNQSLLTRHLTQSESKFN